MTTCSNEDRRRASSLFKAYDVRGIVLNELTPALAREIGRAIVAVIRAGHRGGWP